MWEFKGEWLDPFIPPSLFLRCDCPVQSFSVNLKFTTMLKDLTASKFDSTQDSEEVIIESLSGKKKGEYGTFRTVTIDGENYNLDDNVIQNSRFYTPKCKATLTTTTYKNKDKEEKTYISGLSINPPEKTLFVLLD